MQLLQNYDKHIQTILDNVDKHEEYRIRECINLRADENRLIPEARKVLTSDFGHRNTSPDPRFKYRGTDYMVEVGEMTENLCKELFEAKHAYIWAPTGHTLNIMMYLTFCKPGDTVMSLAQSSGGYGGMSSENLPGYLGLKTINFPFDSDAMNIKVEESIKMIKSEKPKIVIFGASYFLFPQPITEIAEAVHQYGGIVAYDGAHVLGLIAGKNFQDPLREGADILFGSTMKSMGGSGGGVAATNSTELFEKLEKAGSYVAITGVLWNRVPALGITFAHMLDKGKEYAERIVSNGHILAAELEKRDIPVMFRDKNYTSSHMILLDLGGLEKNTAGKASMQSIKLEKANIIIDDRGRIGLSEVTRIGMGPSEMVILADLIARAINEDNIDIIKQEVKELKARFLD